MRSKTLPETPLSDPLLEAEVERAVAPYRGKVSAEMLDHYRDRLREALLFHPVGRRLLNRVRPVPTLQNSDNVVGRDASPHEAPATPRVGGKAKGGAQ